MINVSKVNSKNCQNPSRMHTRAKLQAFTFIYKAKQSH